MKNKFLKLTLSTFCLLALAGCASSKENSSSSQTNNDATSSEVAGTTSESTSTSSKDECVTMFTVTFYLNDGTDAVYKTLDVKAGDLIKRPIAPEREGFLFRGWYVDKDCLVENNYALPIISDFELYGKWVEKEVEQPSTSEDTSSNDVTSDNSSDSSSNTDSSVPDSSVPEGITYTIDKLPNWITNDNCIIFAWVWSDANPGEWIETTYDSSDSNNIKVTFTLEEEITGMLLARCKEGTTVPNWNEKGDNPGRVYNKTNNIDVVGGQTTYNGSSWVEAK